MIGITSFARFAGVLGWPAMFPSFAKAAWLDVIPEYNPFKYNSFPVNAARQSSQMAAAVQDALEARAEAGTLGQLPPVLTFQSTLEFHRARHAVVDTFIRRFPFQWQRAPIAQPRSPAETRSLIRPAEQPICRYLAATAPRNYAVTIVTNEGETQVPGPSSAENGRGQRHRGSRCAHRGAFPSTRFHCRTSRYHSHRTMRYYGGETDRFESYRVRLGTLAARGGVVR